MKNKLLLSPAEYNRINNADKSNCMSFALGVTNEFIDLPYKNPDGSQKDLCESFVETSKNYGFNFKKVKSLDEVLGQYAFLLFGWYKARFRNIGLQMAGFHVARVEPYGLIVHKPGRLFPACEVTMDYLHFQYKGDYHVFVFEND